MKPTFKQQFDKIVGAYLRNELNPYDNCACFIGNMLNNSDQWAKNQLTGVLLSKSPYRAAHGHEADLDPVYGFYSLTEICQMENNFVFANRSGQNPYKSQEERIYSAMESTLLLLRQIHESKGEVVEDYIFEKRALIEA